MFNPSRDQVRQFFFNVWAKYRNRQPLEGAEAQALPILLDHPEYHAMLDQPERHREREYPPEHGETNPFLHLSMHLALAEQAAINQPPGIGSILGQLEARHGSRMSAEHVALECLAEEIWQAQRNGTPYSEQRYLACLNRKILA